jgi:2-C-methyl-D-erythritol 4-phosphate cytidylyltransferase
MERDGELEVVDRSRLKAVQTPQIFAAEVLKEAYSAEPNPLFTDDATVVELSGVRLAYYEGERRNIKITTPEDLIIAEALARV